MADELRELVATVDFDFDLGGLLNMDDAINRSEQHLRDLGARIDDVGGATGRLGRRGSNDIDEITDAAGGAEEGLGDLSRGARRTGRDIDSAADRASDGLEDLADAGRRSGGEIRDAADQAERDLRDLGNAGERAGDEIRDAGRRGAGGLNDISDQSRGAADDLADLTRRGSGDLVDLADAGQDSGGRIREALGEAGGGVRDLIPGIGGVMDWLGKLKVTGVGAFTAIAAVATIGLLAVIGKIADEMDVVNDRMSAMLGATAEETDKMKGAALSLYKDGFGESYESIGGDIAIIAGTFRNLNENELTDTAEKMAVIGDLWGKETSEITTATSVMTKTFKGLGNSDALDLMTTAFQKAGPGGEDLLDTIGEYSVYFEKAGQGAEGFIGSLVKGMQAGARNTDVVADAFKEFGIMSVEVGGKAGPAMEKLGFDSEKMIADLAGGGPKAKAAFNAITAAISMVKDPIEMNSIGVDTFGTKWEDLRDKIILSMNSGEDAVAGFQGATDRAGNQLFDNWSSKWLQFKRTLKGTFMGMIDQSGFATFLTGLGQNLIDALPAITAGISQFFTWVVDSIASSGIDIGQVMDSLVGFFEGTWSLIQGLWNLIGPLITGQFAGAFGLIGAVVTTTFNLIGDVFAVFGALFSGNWSALWTATKNLFSNAWTGILGILQSTLNIFYSLWETTFVRLWNFLAGVGIKMVQAGRDLLNGLINGVKEVAPAVGQAIVDVATSMWDGFKSFFGINSPSRLMMEAGGWIMEGLKSGVMDRAKAAIDAVKNVAKDMWNGVKDFFGIASPSKLMIEAGGFVVEGMEVGISDTASQAIGAAREMSKGVATAAADPKVVDLASYRGSRITKAVEESPEVLSMARKPQPQGGNVVPMPMSQPQRASASDSRPTIVIQSLTIPVTIQGASGGSTADNAAIEQGAREAAMKGFNAAMEEYMRNLNVAIGE